VAISPVTELALPRLPEPIAPTALGDARGASGPASSTTTGAGLTFSDVLGQVVENANHMDAFASSKVEALARGASDDLHGTMIAVKEAEISVKLVGTIRNKLLDAFNEIWKTSV